MSGIKHWKWQRYGAILLIPLSIWLFTQLMCLPNYESLTLIAWLTNPINGLLFFITVLIAFRHGLLGVEVIAEDYISNETCRNTFTKLCAISFYLILGFLAIALILTITGA